MDTKMIAPANNLDFLNC